MEYSKSVVLRGKENFTIEGVPLPTLTDSDIEINVSACGVCGSDVHMWKAGKSWAADIDPFVMGHEFCGVVTNPNQSSFKVGDRVVFWANLYCSSCDNCSQGMEHLCSDVNGRKYIGFICNGGYSKKFIGRAKNAYKLPDSVSDIAAATIDPLMVAYHAVIQADIKKGDKILICGSGIIGNFIANLCKLKGASYVVMTHISEQKILKSKELGFVDHYCNASDVDLLDANLKSIAKDGFDVAFEAVGSEHATSCCISNIKPGHKIVLIGNTISDEIKIPLNKVVLHEIKLLGSVSCTEKEFRETIDLIASGAIEAEKYVTDIVCMEKLQSTMLRLCDNNDPILKAVVLPNI